MKYCIGESIICDDVRYIRANSKNSKNRYLLYHSNVSPNIYRKKVRTNGRWTITKFYTQGCNDMDNTGFCKGHMITREDFTRIYCGGVLPGQLIFKKSVIKKILQKAKAKRVKK